VEARAELDDKKRGEMYVEMQGIVKLALFTRFLSEQSG